MWPMGAIMAEFYRRYTDFKPLLPYLTKPQDLLGLLCTRNVLVGYTQIKSEGIIKKRANGEKGSLLQFAPFQNTMDKSFWHTLSSLKLNKLGIDESQIPITDLEGNIVDVPNPGSRGLGYRYFGAMKKLPGVKELFEKPSKLRKRRIRGWM